MEGELRKQAPRLSLIDVSSEDDSLVIASPSSDFRNHQTSALPETCNELNCFGVVEAESAQGVETAVEMVPVSSEPSEPNRARKAGKCNLRKSLAWDSAFFTSEGVLDPDELAIVTKPLKAAAQILPSIEEDTRRSTESNSTLGSDSWAVESLEVDLFEDIRASIQRSGHGCDASNVTSSSGKAAQAEPASQKVQLTSRNQMKPVGKLPCTSKRQSISKLETEKKVEDLVSSSLGVSRKVDQNLSLRPPKIVSGANPGSMLGAKISVAASDCAKVKNNTSKVCGNVVNQRPAVSKKQVSSDSRRVTPSTLPSPKSSFSSTCSTKMRPAISGSSITSSDSTSSSSTGKSGTKNLRNKTISRNAEQSSVVSTRTPLRNPTNKIRSRNSHLSAYVMSTSKFSSSISPDNSLDGMSSESSSSICSASHRPSSSKASVDVISLDSLESDIPQSPDSQKHVYDQPHVGDEDSGKKLLNQGVEKASAEPCPLSHPPPAAAPKSLFSGNVGLHFKPSGLRMPSPKIGFFDAEKSAGITLNGCLESHTGMQIGPVKNASASGNLSRVLKQKSFKFQPTRSLTQTGLVKFNSNNIRSPQYAAASRSKSVSTPHHQLPMPTAELSGTLAATDSDPNMFVKERHELSSSKQEESNEKTIFFSEDKLDDLSRQVKNVNLNIDSAKDLRGVKGFSLGHFGTQSSGSSSALISSPLSEEFIQDRKVNFVHSLTNPIVSTSPNKVELKLNARSPLAINCSFGNITIALDPMSEPTSEKCADKTSLSPLEKVMKALPVPPLDHADEIGWENVIANGFHKNWVCGLQKENNSE